MSLLTNAWLWSYPPPPTPPCSHLRADLYYFRYDGGPVIWTIKSSHTPLVSGRSWNTAMMLLKSEKSRRGRKRKKKKTKKQWGCVVIKVFFFFFVARGRVLHVWMERAWLELDACVHERVLPWQACAWVWCVLCFGIMCILFPHLDFAQRRSNVKWGISAARARTACFPRSSRHLARMPQSSAGWPARSPPSSGCCIYGRDVLRWISSDSLRVSERFSF